MTAIAETATPGAGEAERPRASAPREYFPSIDLVKGLCAIWVPMIHAEALALNPLMVYLFNRAAPLFVVLMGVNAELWWRRRDFSALGTWYRSRVRRLYPPMWAAVAVWWVLAFLAPAQLHPKLSIGYALKHVAGWLNGVGTGWFVTYAIEIAALYPLLHWAARRFGALPVLVAGIASTAVSFTYRIEILSALGYFGWFAFAPRLLAEVAFGLWLAPRVGRLGWGAGLLAGLAIAAYFAVPLALGEHSPWNLLQGAGVADTGATAVANRLTDLPVCVLLLVLCGSLAKVRWLATPLAWLGRESYGIYLGQMLAHNAASFLVGIAPIRARIGAEGYALVLLGGGIGWAVVSGFAGEWFSRFRRASLAVALVAALATVADAGEAKGPLVLMVGDSMTQGVCEGCPRPPAVSPAAALELLRERLPASSPWREMRAVAAGVGGTTSADWVQVRPDVCALIAGRGDDGPELGLRVLRTACERKTGLARALREVVGETPALVLLVLGANDVMNHVAPETYVANLRAIAAELAPAPTLIATPFWSPQPERAGLAQLAEAVRSADLLRGPDFYATHLPVDGSRVHLTSGGYAAAAALWLDKLPP